MRKGILALESLDEVQSDPQAAEADDQIVESLEAESDGLAHDLERADQAEETSQAMVNTIQQLQPDDQSPMVLSIGGSDALAASLEHMLTSLGLERNRAHDMVAMEGLSVAERPDRLAVSMEGVMDVIKKVGQAIWKILQKIVDWLVTLYQKITLSVKRMKSRLMAANHASAAAPNSHGGHEIKNRTMRNFFNHQGLDIESEDVPNAVVQNTVGVKKLWNGTLAGCKKAATSAEWFIEHPGSQYIPNSFNKGWNAERARLTNEFTNGIFGAVINQGAFTSRNHISGGVHLVDNELHMPFGNYVMRFTMLDANAPRDAESPSPFNYVRSDFMYEPPKRSETRQPLLSLSDHQIDQVLSSLSVDLHFLEQVEREAQDVQKQMRNLASRAQREMFTEARSFAGDRVRIESYGIAMAVIKIAGRLAHGPLGGLSIYTLKAAHYSLKLVEKSLKVNATGPALDMGTGVPTSSSHYSGAMPLLTH